MKAVIFILCSFLVSCGTYSDGESIWSEGGWLLFWVPFLASLVFLYFAYRASQSGSKQQVNLGTRDVKTEYSDKNVPIYKTGQFIFFVILLLASFVVVIVQNVNK